MLAPKNSFRHFTTAGYERMNQLIADIACGNAESLGPFLEMIQDWITRTRERLQHRIFGDTRTDEIHLESVADETLFSLIADVQLGEVQGWSKFSSRFQNNVCHRFGALRHRYRNLLCERTRLRNTIPDRPHYSPVIMAEQEMLREKIAHVLGTLKHREREVIKLRYGLGGSYHKTLEECGRIFKTTRERVRQIEAKAIRKLQHPVRARQFEGFLERPQRDDDSSDHPKRKIAKVTKPTEQERQNAALARASFEKRKEEAKSMGWAERGGFPPMPM